MSYIYQHFIPIEEGKKEAMDFLGNKKTLIIVLLFVSAAVLAQSKGTSDIKVCYGRKSPCFLKQIPCPKECPLASPTDKNAKICYLNCDSPICKAECKSKLLLLLCLYNVISLFVFFFVSECIKFNKPGLKSLLTRVFCCCCCW